MAPQFLHTNVLSYAFTEDARAVRAQQLLEAGCVISVQGPNEFANVARRKLGMSWRELHDALEDIRALCVRILDIDMDTHATALQIAERYQCAFVNALMIASAVQSGSDVMWSEDLHDGLVIDGRLRIGQPVPKAFSYRSCSLSAATSGLSAAGIA